ncbi:MAG: hypothetical protein AABX52_02775 [Nanoarchaeota archaeon]
MMYASQNLESYVQDDCKGISNDSSGASSSWRNPYASRKLYAYIQFHTPQLAVGDGKRFRTMQAKSIDDVIKSGAVLMNGKILGDPAYGDGAKLMHDAYKSFRSSDVGKEAAKELGNVEYNGYAMMDFGDSVIAAVISYNTGEKILAWNSRYRHVLENPQQHKDLFLEAMVHEMRHGSGDLDERSTYNFVGNFFSKLAHKVGSYMSGLYEKIAGVSYKKADVFASQPAMGH